MYNEIMSIKIRLTDSNHKVKPETVKLRDLSKLLAEAEMMLLSQIEHNGIDSKDITIALTEIQHESVGMVLGDSHRAETAMSEIVQAITTLNFNSIAQRSIKSLRKYVDMAEKLDCHIEIQKNNTLCATITKDTTIPERAAITECESVIYGKVIAVGNRKLSVKLELLTGELLTFYVNEEHARQLARRLLDDVMLYGDKEIDIETFDIVGFKMTSIDEDYGIDSDMPISEWVELVRSEVDFSHLDKVGAEAYLREVRGEE